MLKALFFCGILTVSMSIDLKSEGAAMDITTKKGRRGRKDIDRIIVEKGRRGDFSPLQPDHYHSFYEIFYLWSGSCRFLLKDTVYQMEAGDLVFIAPGELHHSLYSAGEVCEIVMIYFKEEYLHLSDRSADSLTSISGQGLQLHSFMGSVPTVYQEYLHSLLTRMLTENSRFDQYSEHFERCYLEELLLMLMRHSVMNEKEPIVEKGRRGDFSPLQPDHYHSFYEIFYLWSGSCRFLLKDTVYQMEAGDLVFIAPGELHHSLYSAGEVCEIVMIYFKEEYLHLSDRSADSLTSISGQGLQLHSFMGSVPTVYQEYLHSLLTRMLTENSRFDQYSEHFERCYLEELLLMLMRHSVMNEKEPDLLNSRDADILLATKYIYNNFRKPLTLEEVSSVASLSPTYFSKKFKLITGMGFKEYLNYVRLKHAQTALLTTNSSITDIALEYGFNDSNYFKDLFKKVYGKSPREYRKNPD
jgi:AraC-like DNA-binding protein/quercetin dioxygenase-like cupin family protein